VDVHEKYILGGASVIKVTQCSDRIMIPATKVLTELEKPGDTTETDWMVAGIC
jgi:hypothetical protein